MTKAVFILGLCLTSQGLWAEDISTLCQKNVEGTYSGTVLGSYNVRINIFCASPTRMEATFCPTVSSDGKPSIDAATNFSSASVDGDHLIFANFSLESSDRMAGSSKSIVSYIKVDLEKFLAGELDGYYMSGNMAEFGALNAKKIQSYPTLSGNLKTPMDGQNAAGTFNVVSPGPYKNFHMIFDVLDGTPVVYLTTGGGDSIHMTDGPAWDGSGRFSVATAEGNGGEADDDKLWYIRGAFTDANHVQFYLVSPTSGLIGPLQGLRIQSAPSDLIPLLCDRLPHICEF